MAAHGDRARVGFRVNFLEWWVYRELVFDCVRIFDLERVRERG